MWVEALVFAVVPTINVTHRVWVGVGKNYITSYSEFSNMPSTSCPAKDRHEAVVAPCLYEKRGALGHISYNLENLH